MSHSDDAPDAGKVAAAGEAWKLPKLAPVRARASQPSKRNERSDAARGLGRSGLGRSGLGEAASGSISHKRPPV